MGRAGSCGRTGSGRDSAAASSLPRTSPLGTCKPLFLGGEHRKPRPAGTSPQVHDVPAMQKKEARPGTFRNPAGLWIEKKAATYSPTVRSTIGAAGLNCSVRDGKRWNPRAMAASMTDKPRQRQNNKKGKRQRGIPTKKGNQGRFGRLVMLGCDVATYAPASYRRHRL